MGCHKQWEHEVLFPPKIPTFNPSERQSAPPNFNLPQSKWVCVEEVDDEEAGGFCRWVQEFDGAAQELEEGKTLFDKLCERQEAMCKPPLAPFTDEEEWELA